MTSGPLPTSSASPLSMADFGEPRRVALDEEIVAAYDSLLHAELVRGRLESSGIGARLEDAHTVGMASHLASAVGGVKVVIAKSDLEAARALLSTPALIDEDDGEGLQPVREKTVDDVARWALRLAVFGVVFPVVGQIASFAFALQAMASHQQLTRSGRQRLALAVAVDVSVLGALAVLLT